MTTADYENDIIWFYFYDIFESRVCFSVTLELNM